MRSRTLELLGAEKGVLDTPIPAVLDVDGAVHLRSCQWAPGDDSVSLSELLDAYECPDCTAETELGRTTPLVATARAALSGAALATDETEPDEVRWCRDTLRRVELERSTLAQRAGEASELTDVVDTVLEALDTRATRLRVRLRGLAEQVRKECARLRAIPDDSAHPLSMVGISSWRGSHNQLLNLVLEAYAEEGNGRGTLVMVVPRSVREWTLQAMHPRIGESHRGPSIPPDKDPTVVLEIVRTLWDPHGGGATSSLTEVTEAAVLLA